MTRSRRTRGEIEAFDQQIRAIAERVQPATCRQLYYRAVVARLVAKDDRGYRQVCESLSRQRWAGSLPWEWVVDETRTWRAPQRWADANRGLASFAETYRRDLWRSQPSWVEIWVESDSLAGTLVEVTWGLAVPLYSGRGFSSISALREAAEAIMGRARERWQGTTVLYVGDLDPSGWEASGAAERGIRRHLEDMGLAPSLSAHLLTFRRLAVNPADVAAHNLPTGGEPKAKGPGSTSWWNFEDGPRLPYTVEAEAFEPATMRELVRGAILDVADKAKLNAGLEVERLERETLALVAERGLPS